MNLHIISIKKSDFDTEYLKKMLLLVRPFHIVHQVAIIFLVIATKKITPNPVKILLAWSMAFLLMPLLFGINDWIHREEDQKMGRNRLFSNRMSKHVLLIPPVAFLTYMTIIAATAGWVTVISLYAMIFCGTLYGLFKHLKKTVMTYLFRALSGYTFYLLIAAYFSLSPIDWKIAAFIAVWDLAAHIAGDLRDYSFDRIGNVRTLPVRMGLRITWLTIFILQIVSLALLELIFRFGTDFWNFQFLLVCIGWIAYFTIHSLKLEQFEHAAFHGMKIATIIFIAQTLFNTSNLIQPFLLAWIISYLLYLWGDDRMPNFNIPAILSKVHLPKRI